MTASNIDNLKERVAAILLEELKEWNEGWYYISIVHAPTNTFYGGVVLKATGHTHAWVLLHSLNLIGKDCETQTTGPIDPDIIVKIPDSMRWRLLTRKEVEALGE